MKRRVLTLAVVFAASCILAVPAAFAGTGNGAPSGPHFNLNIHGVAKGQGFSGNNQNDIFVPLYGTCKISLQQSFTYDFQVLQPDCVNNSSATFSLPAPCAISSTTGLCTGTETIYSVWARALAKPGGSSTTTTCATDVSDGALVCSLNQYVVVRGTGPSKFSNVSSSLLFLTTCDTTTGRTVSTPLFSQNYQNYFWNYANDGLRLLQLRFYQVPSMVPTSVACV